MKALERITPEEAGISSQQMEKLLCSLMHERTQMNGFMAARDGKVFAECWWKPYHKDMVHSNHSIGKSYTWTVLHCCLEEVVYPLFRHSRVYCHSGCHCKNIAYGDLL